MNQYLAVESTFKSKDARLNHKDSQRSKILKEIFYLETRVLRSNSEAEGSAPLHNIWLVSQFSSGYVSDLWEYLYLVRAYQASYIWIVRGESWNLLERSYLLELWSSSSLSFNIPSELRLKTRQKFLLCRSLLSKSPHSFLFTAMRAWYL